jgi:hypothetical protein
MAMIEAEVSSEELRRIARGEPSLANKNVLRKDSVVSVPPPSPLQREMDLQLDAAPAIVVYEANEAGQTK